METGKQKNNTIAIIGTGHMGQALVAGLLQGKKIRAHTIIVSNPSGNHLPALKHTYNVHCTRNNLRAVKKAHIVILAVKPNNVTAVMSELKEALHGKILVSVVVGISLQTLENMTAENQKIIRIMPNIPITYGAGVIGFISNKNISAKSRNEFVTLMSPLGIVLHCQTEALLDSISLIGGCGPAIVSYFIELVTETLRVKGFEEQDTKKISLQIFAGTLQYLLEKKISPKLLQQSVATKGGTTEEIILSLENSPFKSIFLQSIEKGFVKVKKIACKVL